jgi:hypothetical protein
MVDSTLISAIRGVHMEAEEEKVDTNSGKPPGISKDDIVFDQENPYRARAVSSPEPALNAPVAPIRTSWKGPTAYAQAPIGA